MVKIAVLGAGCMGLGAAVKIKESFPDAEVVILSKEFSPDTTGDGSGGLWCPYLCGSTPVQKLSAWGGETYKLYHKLWLEGGCNICLLPFYSLRHNISKDPNFQETPLWAKDVFGFNLLGPKQLKYFNDLYSSDYVQGYTFTSFIVPPPIILPFLTKRFLNAGGRLVRAAVTSLDDAMLAPYDVIVNCTGLNARTVVPDDKVFPIRGQILKVQAPWLHHAIIDEDGDHYILPNYKSTVMGGTHQEHNYSTKVNDEDTAFIQNGCYKIIPALKNAKILDNWAGLRPGRDTVRLEAEHRNGKLYIHNYGHGGSGLTLFWGCATDVVKILEQNLKNAKTTVISKL
ncbi:unnamed protein product [Plutella xylostella]|uniref:(diamondback moth) hypothetical protein n=1 Tax=Plutella xylostella TaxID=51655 RepID=A0A8S4FWL5_PLUXY|nr:unnamed protein product [Plutella xylostella]